MVLLTILQSGFVQAQLSPLLSASLHVGRRHLTHLLKGKKKTNKIFDPLGAQIFHLVA